MVIFSVFCGVHRCDLDTLCPCLYYFTCFHFVAIFRFWKYRKSTHIEPPCGWFVCVCVPRTPADSHICLETNDPLTCVWASGLWWMITPDPLERKGIHLSPVRMDVMMNVAARCCLDSPEVGAVTNYPHRGSEARALLIWSTSDWAGATGNHAGNRSL